MVDFVTGLAAHLQRRMDDGTGTLVGVALDTSTVVNILTALHQPKGGMLGRLLCEAHPAKSEKSDQTPSCEVSDSHSGSGSN